MSTLQRRGRTHEETSLVGRVGGQAYELTLQRIRELAHVDTGIRGHPDRQYRYPNEGFLSGVNLRETDDWFNRVRTIFMLPENNPNPAEYHAYDRADLEPRSKVLWRVGVWNIFPREGDQQKVRFREITILYGLITGRIAISYAHLVMLQLWSAFDIKEKTKIPHGYLLSRFLKEVGAIAAAVVPREIRKQHRMITQRNMPDLEFKRGPDHYAVIDPVREQAFIADFTPEEQEQINKEREERRRRREEQQGVAEEEPHSPPIGRTATRGEASGSGPSGQAAPDYERLLQMMDSMNVNIQDIRSDQQRMWDHLTGEQQVDRTYMDERFGQLNQQMEAQQQQLNAVQTGVQAQAYMEEYYRHQDWLYRENLRHHQDYQAGVPYTSWDAYQQPDYPQLDHQSPVAHPSPTPPTSVFFPESPTQQPGGAGSSDQLPDQFQSFYYGIFGSPPPQ